MFKCANCDNPATVIWCPPSTEKLPFCAEHRPGFTFKPEYAQYISEVVAVADEPETEEAPKPKPSKKQAPSEAPAEETPTETAPEEEPNK